MNWLDRTVGWISPKKAYERAAWRESLDQLRSYDAGTDDRLNANWRAVNSTAENTDKMFRDNIRARSRDLERNSDILESVVLAFERNVVGGGFRLQAKTKDEEINDRIENLFEEWTKPNNCDVTQQQSFSEICQMLVRRKKIDGGIIIVLRYIDDGIVPLALQMYEVDDLDTMISPSDNKKIVNGIEYNEFNRPVAYYLRKYDMHGMYTGASERILAKDVLFLYKKKRPSQIREMSELSSTLPRIRDMNQYMEAVSVKERVAALLAVLIKRVSPAAGAPGRGSTTTDKRFGYSGKSLTPGMIMELNPGDDVSVVQPPSQGAGAADFVRLQQRLTGSAQGISYEVTARDMSQVNYSSARQGLLEDQKTYLMEQKYLISHFLIPVYEAFIESAILKGELVIKDFYEKKREYLAHKWIAPGMKWIDPLKEANANKVALATNQTTLAEIAGSTGQDWRELIEQRGLEIEYMIKKGVITSDTDNKAKIVSEKKEQK
ncbi:phage portal protein [Psychrobacillus sp. FSL K6-1267]|uniref:phage portal protein n=1 Tax=Psychrobacillus sp. FSL K6-1267 TaxID=2921543 RepID=UPI0030F5E3E5